MPQLLVFDRVTMLKRKESLKCTLVRIKNSKNHEGSLTTSPT